MTAKATICPATETALPGIGVTSGVVIAPVYSAFTAAIVSREVGSPESEARLLRAKLDDSANALMQLAANVDEQAAAILEFQVALLEDEDLMAPVFGAIENGVPAHSAWRDAMDAEIAIYREGDDPVFAARAADLEDLRDRVLAALADDDRAHLGPTCASIVVARDLAPSRFLEFDLSYVAGIALVEGSPTSHVALLARARGIPMVVGLGCLEGIDTATIAVLDVKAGCLVLQPSAETLAAAEDAAMQIGAAQRRADRQLPTTVHTADGERVRILVNLDHISMLEAVNVEHCDGVGLARTEFLFQSGPPDEASQLVVYARLIEWASGRPVTIRTLDAGGDKPVPGLDVEAESNPFLGMRGVRLMLKERAIFKTQLRALLRAAALGPLKVMIPMVTEPSEMVAVSELMDEACSELAAEGIPFARPELGMMVEVPVAALCAARFAADFYSIGSNDLIQYATASARDNAAVAYLGRSDHPGVSVLIEMVVSAGLTLNREVSVCGDMASSPDDALRLVRLGVRVLSVAPAMLGPVKAALTMDVEAAR